jgi:uncharacterized OsmC-like protein
MVTSSDRNGVTIMETTKHGKTNGVDVDRLFATIGAIQATPSLATFKFRASNKWIGGGRNRSSVQGFYGAGQEDATRKGSFVMDNDEPDVLLGSDQAANPVENVLHALAGCITTSFVYHAAARGIAIDAVESTLEGDLDLRGFLGLSDKVRNGYEGVRVTLKVKSSASPEQLAELSTIAQQRSPVFDIITNKVPVTVLLAK